MKKIKINLKRITQVEINLIIDYFKRGKIVVYPTDTIYGLGCLATNKKATKRIFKIKGREKRKPLLILVGSLKMLKKYCQVSKEQERYLATTWGGRRAISAILKKKGSLPPELTAGQETVAVRLPKNRFLIKILSGVGRPIVSTSLNLSGQKSLDSVSRLDNYFKKTKPDLVIDAGRLVGESSRLVDVRDLKNIIVLRK